MQPRSPCFETWTPDEELRRPAYRLSRMFAGSGSLLGKMSPFSLLKVSQNSFPVIMAVRNQIALCLSLSVLWHSACIDVAQSSCLQLALAKYTTQVLKVTGVFPLLLPSACCDPAFRAFTKQKHWHEAGADQAGPLHPQAQPGDSAPKLSDINTIIQRHASQSAPQASAREPPRATLPHRPMSAPSPGMAYAWQPTMYQPCTIVRTLAKHDVPGTNITFRKVSTAPCIPPFRLNDDLALSRM